MLTCRACVSRCLSPADRPALNALRNRLRSNVTPLQSHRFLRTSAPAPAPADNASSDRRSMVSVMSTSKIEPWKRSRMAANQKKREQQVLHRSADTKSTQDQDLDKDKDHLFSDANIGRRSASRMSSVDWNRRKAELRFLQDPLELATFVKKELVKNKPAEMLQLVQMASHSMDCIVSWNHIIDHYLAKEKVNDALKVYNDMKKRAQFPDSYTYTILLRGLSINAHNSGVLTKALSIYHSLSAPNSRVEPSIIHTNAALRVCARAADLDALWGIAAKIPESGPASANVITYITILNAIRQDALLGRPSGETAEEAAARRDRSVMEGRRMWEIIVGRWRKADLMLDEELVCAMGRLLLVGARPRDWDDVLSLVEQTMDIPRLVPRLGTPERQEAGVPRLRAPNVPAQFRFDDDHLTPDQSPMRGDEFLPVSPPGAGGARANSLTYVRPGNNTLSLVLEACQKVVATKVAQEYWDLLTDPATCRVVPDLNNLHQHLRNLRLNRASTAAVKLVEEDIMAKGLHPRPATFRIAMSTCVRDKNNHNSLRNAGRLLQAMLKTLPDIDARAVGMYAELAIKFPLAKGQDIVDALTILKPVIKNLRMQLWLGGERARQRGVGTEALSHEARLETFHAICQVYGIYDRLLLSNLIPEEEKAVFKQERATLSAFIFKYKQMGTGKSATPATPAKEESKPLGDEADLHGYLADEGVEVQAEDIQGEGIEGKEKEAQPEPWKRKDKAPWIERAAKEPEQWKVKDTAPWKGRESWRTQRARPEGQRKPWSS